MAGGEEKRSDGEVVGVAVTMEGQAGGDVQVGSQGPLRRRPLKVWTGEQALSLLWAQGPY